jgi:hypothetical protein
MSAAATPADGRDGAFLLRRGTVLFHAPLEVQGRAETGSDRSEINAKSIYL